jgi:hypothetical protein
MTEGAQRPFALIVIAFAVAAILACDGAGECRSFPDRLHGVYADGHAVPSIRDEKERF